MTWSYNLQLTANKDKLRLMIGDTDQDDPLMSDEELAYLISTHGSLESAAAAVCHSLAAKYARYADKQVGDLRLSLSQRAKQFYEMAKSFTKTAQILAAPTAGGVYTSDKESWDANESVVKTAIKLGIHDNV